MDTPPTVDARSRFRVCSVVKETQETEQDVQSLLDDHQVSQPFAKSNGNAPRATRFNSVVETIPQPNNTGDGIVNPAYANSTSSARKSSAMTSPELEDNAEDQPLEVNANKVSLNQVALYFKDTIRSKQKEIYVNCFLFVLVGIILTAIIIFVVINPIEASYEITLNKNVIIWPLKKRLFVQHDSTQLTPLIVEWGHHSPTPGNVLPSYCTTTNDKSPRCSERECCFTYHKHSKLDVSLFSYKTNNSVTGCAHMQWQSLHPEVLQPVEFKDCFLLSSSTRHWYGGLLDLNTTWPISWTEMQTTEALTGDPLNKIWEPLGILEGLWMTSDGYSLRVDSQLPFSISVHENISDGLPQSMCLTASQSLGYTVCQSTDMRDLVQAARIIDLKPIDHQHHIDLYSESTPAELPVPDVLHDKMFLRVDTSTLDTANLMVRKDEVMSSLEALSPSMRKRTSVQLDKCSPVHEGNTQLSLQFVQLFESLNTTEPVKFSASISNLVSLMDMNTTAQQSLLPQLIWRRASYSVSPHKLYYGQLWWRESVVSALDITRANVQEWWIRTVESWALYSSVDWLHVQGGSARHIPAEPADLNITHTLTLPNINMYTKKLAEVVQNLGKTLTVDAGYRSQSCALYMSVPASPALVDSVIPVALALSLQGYNYLSLHVHLDHSPNLQSLSLLVELALFFPVFSLPLELTLPNCNTEECMAFKNVSSRVWNLRDTVIMPHYKRAYERHSNAPNSEPILRPVWWDDQAAIVGSQSLSYAHNIGHQIMIGRDLVFTSHNTGDNSVYLPKGVWRDPLWHTGTVNLTHGQRIIYATRSRVSCFVRQ